jgi:uncharacterized membrane protein
MSYYDHHKRSIAKTIGFFAILVVADWVVVFLITNQTGITFKIIIYSNFVSAIIYFIHERAWNKVHWGRSKIQIDLGEQK